jgi:DNA-binding transcriptional LysR family regulator
MSDLDKFELFACIADAGSITQAANQLGVTKALLSRQLKRLEQDLRVDLFRRQKQRLHLTETGQLVLDQCRRLKRELDDTRDLCQSIHDEPEGVIHVVALGFFARQLIYPKLADFIQQYPKLLLYIDTSERLPDFEKQQIDVAVGFTLLVPENIIQRRIQDFRYIMAASPNYFLQYGHPKKLTDLINHRYIGHKARDEVRSINLKKPHKFSIRPQIVLNNIDAMVDCAKQGLGIIQLPSYLLAQPLKDGLLEETLKEYQANKVNVYCYYPRFRYVQPKVRKFLDFIFNQLE